MATGQTGYQPRNTPAERRAFFDAKRITTDLDGRVTDLENPDQITVNRNATGVNYISNKTGAANADGAIHISIRSAGTEIGRITRATSTTAGFLTTSDEDLKENLTAIDDDLALQWMRMIEPYFFNYIDTPDVRHVGYSAQRVAQQWPNGVANGIITPGWGDVDDRTWDADGNETTPPEVWQAWMMDHSKITPILHAGLQTIDRIVTDRTTILADHEQRIADLETTVIDQADQIAVLEARVTALADALADLRVEIYYTRQMTAFWQYSATTAAPPGGGQMRTNIGLTEMYLNKTDSDGYNRATTMASIIAATTVKPDGGRFRIRGTTGRVLEIRTNGIAVDNGTYITIPIKVISGDTADRGFRVEIVMWSQIWAEDPPPLPTPLAT